MKAPRYKWQPTTAEIAAAAGMAPEEVERFDHNTSATPTPWAVEKAALSLSGLNEYPAANYRTLRDAASMVSGLDPEQIVPGAGADELILLCGRAFLDRGDTALATTPTYPLYEIATLQAGAVLQPVPASPPDFEFPVDDVVRAARDADLVWLCAPSNPIGNAVSDDAVDAVIAATDGLVVIDAAYAEFSGTDWSVRVARHHNVIVLRTLSKAYGIAGARVGYAMAHPDLIAAIDGIRPPGSISSVSVELGIAALENPQSMRATVATVQELREELTLSLASLGLRALPSQTNFVLCEVGARAASIAEQLMDEGLVVRKFPSDGPLANYLRFTVRTTSAHTRLISALERYLP
ncbi:MAG: histidinol-phosphate aminotransferase family protein [bacterium]|nr:histidinol-phosphate aminotransferase family protein [bacterium]